MTNIFEYTDYRLFLKVWLENKKKETKIYSHRFIADKIGLKSGGHISLILTGKANLSGRTIENFAQLIKLDPQESIYFKYMVLFNQAKEYREQKACFDKMLEFKGSKVRIIDTDQYEYFSKWYYSAIREILAVVDFSGDYKALGMQLIPPITSTEVRDAIELLERLDMIQEDDQGVFKSTEKIISTGPQVQGLYLNEHILNILGLAQDAIQRIPVGEKYNSWISMAIEESSFLKIVEELRQTRKRILKIVEKDKKPTRVFHLNLNLFPFSQKQKNKAWE